MDDLPELPFEKVLSYLSLEDRLRLSAVSRSCHQKIANSRVKTLCFSERPIGRILGKSRWVSGAFAENFISSTRFASFFDTFGQSVLSSLKHLRLCDLDLNKEDPTAFTRTLNSFGQLEQLDIIRVHCGLQRQFKLNLPMLTSIRLEHLWSVGSKLTIEAPRLRAIKRLASLELKIVHGESVESLHVDWLEYAEVKKLENLQYLYADRLSAAGPKFLSKLPLLKEIQTKDPDLSELFKQKRRYGRADLKIYLYGLLLNGPHDPAINVRRSDYLNEDWLVCLAENRSRLADQIPFHSNFYYSDIEGAVSGLEEDLLKRFTHLTVVTVTNPVQDIQRFLDLLKNRENISELSFFGDQPQDLFDQLPEHCAVQSLSINPLPSDVAFLFRLKHLIYLQIGWPIDTETIRRAFDELPFLSSFVFRYLYKSIRISTSNRREFHVLIDDEPTTISNLNAAIEFITSVRYWSANDLE